jgi:hypothetical protein
VVRPAHAPSPSARTRCSGKSRSGRRVRRSGGSGGGSTGNKGVRNSGCASSRDYLPRRRRSTRRRERKRRKKATGGGGRPLLRGGSLHPPTESRGGGGGASAGGRRGSAHRRAIYGRGGACRRGAGARRGGVWDCDDGDVGRGLNARRALEEEEAGLFHPELGHRSSRHPIFERREFNPSILRSQGGACDNPPRKIPYYRLRPIHFGH